MKWVAALVALVSVGLSPCIGAARPATVARFAIVVGNNQPDGANSAQLHFADDDAVATHQLLLDAGVESHLLVTLDADSQRLHASQARDGAPSLRELERIFSTVSAEMRAHAQRGEATELLLFYSGHGDTEHGEGYVVLEDGHLTRSRLFGLLSRSPATRNHVFVDACKSYFLVYPKGPGGRRSAYATAFVESAIPAQLANTGFVLSTSSDHDSHEWDRIQAGIFSYELRSALRGAADADLDGRISYKELGAFLTVANDAIENAQLKPQFTVRPPRTGPDWEILSWKTETAALRLAGPGVGHLYVQTAKGVRVLDAHPASGEVVSLHLPETRPLYVRKDDNSAEYVLTQARLEDEPLALLPPNTPELTPKGPESLVLRQLFASPFGAANVQEFVFPKEELPQSPDEPTPRAQSSLGTVAGWVALGAGGVALTLSAASLATSLSSNGESQAEIEQHNQRIRTLNVASVVGYAVAGVAGVTWGVCRLQLSAVPAATSAQRGREARSLSLRLEGRF